MISDDTITVDESESWCIHFEEAFKEANNISDSLK